ncbi:hypothetical protein [Evansella cellulosilytica]|uniref:Uncharacterized protein n=1 Tax=Evansella cellulosilytica (strain ATCC 21833 / DSM 2522 / FERM P-1141 / JCM 9156 / N-4) TaxID=649639 RepID=E6TT49_EVAC2|nr:hypothetical protein [Evansella cellulosilytica]ADU31957.1 hypothetical protein Bcell_3717 [Evansella cellulosilytica DSM 2522]
MEYYVANILRIIGIAEMIIGVLVSIFIGFQGITFSFFIMLVISSVTIGLLLIGVAYIIEFLSMIVDQTNTTNIVNNKILKELEKINAQENQGQVRDHVWKGAQHSNRSMVESENRNETNLTTEIVNLSDIQLDETKEVPFKLVVNILSYYKAKYGAKPESVKATNVRNYYIVTFHADDKRIVKLDGNGVEEIEG